MLLGSTVLLLTFALYCYVPYMVGRGIFSFVVRVQPPERSQFREFLIAAVPGAAYNYVAYLLRPIVLREQDRSIDWHVVADLFTGMPNDNAFYFWLKAGDFSGPVRYFFLVVCCAAVWSTIVARYLGAMRDEIPSENPPGLGKGCVNLIIIILAFPMFPYLHERYQGMWGLKRIVVVGTRNGHVYLGRVESFEFSNDMLVGIVLAGAFEVSSAETIAVKRREIEAVLAGRLTSYLCYLPTDEIIRLCALSNWEWSPQHAVDVFRFVSGIPVPPVSKETDA